MSGLFDYADVCHWRSGKTRSYYLPFTTYTFPANNVCLSWIEGNEVENSVCLGGGLDLFQCGGWVWCVCVGGDQLIPVVQEQRQCFILR